jgi:glucose 1-dehydrogenase
VSVDLSGRTAVISGGLGDIGRAIACELARHGADIAICDVDTSAQRTLHEEVTGLGRRFRCDAIDVGDDAAVSRWILELEESFGLPDLIIPNAAVVEILPFKALDAARWRRVLTVNLHGAFNLANCAAGRLVAAGRGGRIVFVGSWAADHVHVQIPSYCVSKAGVRMLCRCMAAAFAADGILVNEIAPGYVDGGLSAKFALDDPGIMEASRKLVPIGLLIEPVEVARQVLHLCDPANRHMTGTTVLMDGGLSLVGPE